MGGEAHKFNPATKEEFDFPKDLTSELNGENTEAISKMSGHRKKQQEGAQEESPLTLKAGAFKAAQTEAAGYGLMIGDEAKKHKKQIAEAEARLKKTEEDMDHVATNEAAKYYTNQEALQKLMEQPEKKLGAAATKNREDSIKKYNSVLRTIEKSFSDAGLDIQSYRIKVEKPLKDARENVARAAEVETVQEEQPNRKEAFSKLAKMISKTNIGGRGAAGDIDSVIDQIDKLKKIDPSMTGEQIYDTLKQYQASMVDELREIDAAAEEENKSFFGKIKGWFSKDSATQKAAKFNNYYDSFASKLEAVAEAAGLHTPSAEEKTKRKSGSEAALRLRHHSVGGADIATLGAGGTGIGGVESAMTSRSSIAMGERGPSDSKKQESISWSEETEYGRTQRETILALADAVIKGDTDSIAQQVARFKELDPSKRNEDIYNSIKNYRSVLVRTNDEAQTLAKDETTTRRWWQVGKGPAAKASDLSAERLAAFDKNLENIATLTGLHEPDADEKARSASRAKAHLGGVRNMSNRNYGSSVGGIGTGSDIGDALRNGSELVKRNFPNSNEGARFATPENKDTEVTQKAFKKIIDGTTIDSDRKKVLQDEDGSLIKALAKNGYKGEEQILRDTITEVSSSIEDELIGQGFKEKNGTLVYSKWFGRSAAESSDDYKMWVALKDLQNDVFSTKAAKRSGFIKSAVGNSDREAQTNSRVG